MDKVFLIWDRTWSGRVTATIAHGEDTPSMETISRRLASYELTGDFRRLALSGDPQARLRLCRAFPAPIETVC